jgi:DNA repair photolyase
MALTKSKGNMYSWVSDLWSPIRGCRFKCDYCYAKNYGYGDEVHLNLEDLRTRLGRGKRIFVCHLSDMWGPWVSKEDIIKILYRCREYPENEYVFQSKNPARFKDFLSPYLEVKNNIVGTTIETNRYPEGFKTKAPSLESRVAEMKILNCRKFVTIEPIMVFQTYELERMIYDIRPEFVTIGADSKGHKLLEPAGDQIFELINRLSKFTEIRGKNNLERLMK